MTERDRQRRARERRARIVLQKTHLGAEDDVVEISGAEAVSLVTRLTREAWGALRRFAAADRPRSHSDPVRETRTVTELFPDFRDVLIELADAGAEFVIVGGHAVAFHGHPRAAKDLDILVRPTPENAERVYRALGAFGARRSTSRVE